MRKKPEHNEIEQDNIFQEYVAGIKPIKHDKVYFAPKKPKFAQLQKAKAAANHTEPEIKLADNFTEIDSEAELFYAQSGLQTKVIRKLRRGEFVTEKRLDLHGYTIAEARNAFWHFVQNCLEANMRHVIVIHGKGRHSVEQKVTIKDAVNCWLRQMPEVLAFCSAQPKDGGRGALYVLFKRRKGNENAE